MVWVVVRPVFGASGPKTISTPAAYDRGAGGLSKEKLQLRKHEQLHNLYV